MKTPTVHENVLRRGPLIALACGAAAVLSPAAHASDRATDQAIENSIAQVTVSAPAEKIVGYDMGLIPKEQVTVTAHVRFDPITLTTNSGVALLKDRILETARRLCASDDPEDIQGKSRCVRQAVSAADAQIDAEAAAARNSSPA